MKTKRFLMFPVYFLFLIFASGELYSCHAQTNDKDEKGSYSISLCDLSEKSSYYKDKIVKISGKLIGHVMSPTMLVAEGCPKKQLVVVLNCDSISNCVEIRQSLSFSKKVLKDENRTEVFATVTGKLTINFNKSFAVRGRLKNFRLDIIQIEIAK
ncbi:MAG: hypothetical protein IPG67_01360 [Acidobacteria bacterium]|nr:hypothetical protein [Acidobacteriota bacterium]